MQALPSQIIILSDTKERIPLLFPSTISLLDPRQDARSRAEVVLPVFIVPQRLRTGDYAIQGFESSCLVERKGSALEVATNCLSADRDRFVSTLLRLKSECRHPVLVFEGSIKKAMRPTAKCPNAHLAVDSLLRLLLQYGIEFLDFAPSSMEERRACGELVIRKLIAGALQCQQA